jgi:hypothetical protein
MVRGLLDNSPRFVTISYEKPIKCKIRGVWFAASSRQSDISSRKRGDYAFFFGRFSLALPVACGLFGGGAGSRLIPALFETTG